MRKIHQHIKRPDGLLKLSKRKKQSMHRARRITLTLFVFLTSWRDQWEKSVRHPGPSVTSGLKALQTGSTVKYCCLKSIYFLHHWFRVTNIHRQLLLSVSPPRHFLALPFTRPPSSLNIESAACSIFYHCFPFSWSPVRNSSILLQTVARRSRPVCCRVGQRVSMIRTTLVLIGSQLCTFLL